MRIKKVYLWGTTHLQVEKYSRVISLVQNKDFM